MSVAAGERGSQALGIASTRQVEAHATSSAQRRRRPQVVTALIESERFLSDDAAGSTIRESDGLVMVSRAMPSGVGRNAARVQSETLNVDDRNDCGGLRLGQTERTLSEAILAR